MAVINIKINGKKVSKEVPDNTILSDFLRDTLALTGTHVGCDTSQCGACVIHLNGNSVKSCTTLVADCKGSEVTTIEGLAKNGKLHPMQEAFKKKHGLQCGFCTPGMVMSVVDLLQKNKNPNEQEVVAEQILIAAGRTPQVAGLNLEGIGVTTGDAGVIIDTYLRTSRRTIYAIGDVTPSPKFTHLAAQQAGLALRNMLAGPFKRSTTSLSPLPAITFTTPEVARFGIDSDTAVVQKLHVERLDYAEIDRAVTDQKDGFIEVVVGKKGDIVGATIVGERASEILSPLLVAARGGVPLSDLATTTFAYPTLASGINILASRYATSQTKQKISFKIAARGWRK